MSRIEQKFKELDRPALVSFITAGDPDYETSLEVFKGLPEAGADIIELGMPFTDPVADGPTIQHASERALASGATMKRTFDMVRAFRADNDHTPLVLMGYYNPICAFGIEAFARTAHEAGVDGLIIVDLPPEEDGDLRKALEGSGIDIIRLITPVTEESRLKVLLNGASGFLYYVSITGVTGSASADMGAVERHIEQIKAHTDLPIAVGFGIKTPEDVKAFGSMGGAAVVGSAIVNALQAGVDEALSLVKTLSKGL